MDPARHTFNLLSKAGRELASPPQPRHYLCVGDSAAIFGLAGEMHAAYMGRTDLAFTFVPYSGSMGPPKLAEQPFLWQGRPANLKHLRQAWARTGLTPQRLADDASRGITTTALDVYSTGRGITSFCEHLLLWADENQLGSDVAKALDVLDLRDSGTPKHREYLAVRGHRLPFRQMGIPYYQAWSRFVESHGLISNRMISYYPATEWNKGIKPIVRKVSPSMINVIDTLAETIGREYLKLPPLETPWQLPAEGTQEASLV